jgi:hypothetical protein
VWDEIGVKEWEWREKFGRKEGRKEGARERLGVEIVFWNLGFF